MPLDHYVPQVHLRKFSSPALGGDRMFALRKADLKPFQPHARDVCRIENGSSNAYLREDRYLEEFLKTVEPGYSAAVEKLGEERIEEEVIYTIAGYVASVMSCSPAAMRIGTEPLKTSLEAVARAAEAAGALPSPPASLGGVTLTEMLRDGRIKVQVDPKYPQAIGIAQVLQRTKVFGNFPWEVIRNDFADSPFFTSDFPVAIEHTRDLRVVNRVAPLTPWLAIRICPDINMDREKCDFTFSHHRYRMVTATRKDVARLNKAVVRCAETTVFYRDNVQWVRDFVKKHKPYRIEPRTHELASGRGTLLIWTQQIAPHPTAEDAK